MIIGIPKEIKEGEYRVSATPALVEALVAAGHKVRVQRGAGEHAGFRDEDYRKAGGALVSGAAQVWGAELIVKVKEPIAREFHFLCPGQVLFAFLHLAPNPPLIKALLKRKVTAVAYETVEDNGRRPILQAMSEIAGRIAVIMGAYYQANPQGGLGVLYGGIPGVLPAHIVILGGGTVGENAARVAAGMGCRVTILEREAERMRYLEEILHPHVATLMADETALREAVAAADILIGAFHVPGAKTPRLVTRALVRQMKPRSVIVDVAIDQGGSCETSRPTTHFRPTYVEEGVLHYCVPNMPGAFGHTSTLALTNATRPYLLALAQKGVPDAFREFAPLAKGLQCFDGHITCKPVAESQKLPFTAFDQLLL